jgi:hypothetical protein
MIWVILIVALVATSTRPKFDAGTSSGAYALALIWLAWALAVAAMVAGIVIVEVAS